MNLDLSILIIQLLHPDMLTMFNIQWMEALVYPLRALLLLFYSSVNNDKYKLAHNGQVCYLRTVLNDAFDNEERRITISDVVKYDYVYFSPESDENPILFETVLFADSQLIGSDAADFIVNVPLALNLNNDSIIRFKSILNYYKLVSKRYLILFI